jgi:epoxyqueuosine reductase
MPNSTSEIREAIRARALADGFDVVRFARAEDSAEAAGHLREFLSHGWHGTMGWMAANEDRRVSPLKLWPEAKSIVIVGASYAPSDDPLARLKERGHAAISVYALGDDYHDVLKRRLKRLASFVTSTYGSNVKLFVDTAPVMEKPLAEAAGVGWRGKHTNLVSRQFGSWLFLGSLFTTLALGEDTSEADHCGRCQRCLDICPTDAFPAPYKLDARRCISYLTIEHKGHIDRQFREAIGNRIYGCDDCLAVCPWNKFAQASHDTRFHARDGLDRAPLRDLVRLDEIAFRSLFRQSPIKRIGRDRFVRNVLIAIGNAGDKTLAVEAERLIDDPSPLVRAMAVWALSRLLDAGAFGALAEKYSATESDPNVNAEWSGSFDD